MTTYHISTDACSCDIEAETADEAAREFAADEGIKGIETAADLEAHIEEVGGFGFMEDESGRTYFRIRP